MIKGSLETFNRNLPQNKPTIEDAKARPIPGRPPITIKEIQEKIKASKESLRELEAARAPDSEDLDKFKDFLRQKDTGLFKLFPDLACDTKHVVKVDGDCAKIVQDSYSYSFQKRLYSDGVFHDIRFHENRLWVDGFLSQGIITDLGDIPLENVSLQNNYAEFLINFKPSSKNIEARKQFWELSETKANNGFKYGKVVKMTPNTTYLARIINYQLNSTHQIRFMVRQIEEEDEVPFFKMAFDKERVDTIIAFRVVKVSEDNSILILWKKVSEAKSPKLKFAKGERWMDFKTK